MAENVILAEQKYEGFAYDSEFQSYRFDVIPAPFTIVLGEVYSVVWDEVQYSCEAQDMSAFGEGAIALGNLSYFGVVGNNEPFVIGWTQYGSTIFAFDTKTSHTIAIYQTVEDEPQEEVGIVIKNYSGTPIEYKGVEKVMFNTADGGKRVYSKGEAVENVQIELDFSSGDQTVKAAEGTLVKSAVIKKPETLVAENIKSGVSVAGVEGSLIGDGEEVTVALDMSDGDMVIEPTDGKLFSSVTVEKPDTLIPENIAEGIDIAGIIGTLVAGGGCSNLCMATYTAGSSFIKSTVQLIAKEDLDAIGFGTATKSFVLFIASNTSGGMYNYRFPRVILQTNYSVAYLSDSQSSYGIRMYIYKSSSTTTTTSWSTSNISMSYMSANKIEGAMFYNDSGLQYYGSATYPLYNCTYIIVAGVIS